MKTLDRQQLASQDQTVFTSPHCNPNLLTTIETAENMSSEQAHEKSLTIATAMGRQQTGKQKCSLPIRGTMRAARFTDTRAS